MSNQPTVNSLTIPTDSQAIDGARQLAMRQLGEIEGFNSENERLAYEATVDFIAAQILATWVKRSWSSLRQHVFNVNSSGSWSIVPIPIYDATGEPTGEYTRYDSFDQWFDVVARELNSTYRSTLWTNTTILLPAVAGRPIHTPDGEVITIDKLFDMPESQWELLSSAAQPLARKVNDGDEDAIPALGELINDSLTLSKRALTDKWKRAGFIAGQPFIDGYQVMMKDGTMVIIIHPKTEAEIKRLSGATKALASLTTLDQDDALETLQEVFTDAPTDDDQPDFEEYLSGI